ncbi:hypothetical protein CBS147317_9370 [Penicillium roqueforti]|nr:hypothetical protein CBS147355_9301 [Penicillium roqueforti]KAI2695922.1 hypothetical protein CBS147372_8799 [Penicillium roqueforti]KAI3146281.1 hypothetical protein CBS147317_9370 [Penicillium roqueforti]KAI3196102.1 hypothetical protein CBS147311_7604 [Penicillium roqueforti]KAI3246679.1 hypothetical protein CBS147309_9028 [Penicillium roqueforti]
MSTTHVYFEDIEAYTDHAHTIYQIIEEAGFERDSYLTTMSYPPVLYLPTARLDDDTVGKLKEYGVRVRQGDED